MTLTSRRHLGWILFAAASLFAFLFDYALRVHLRRAELASGLALFSVVVLLTLFNARKKLPFLPLLRASTWLQIHIYAGLLSCVLFGLHVGWRMPQGIFESILAILFCLVSISGVAGLAFSRWAPGRLTVQGENVIFERIPALRTALQREVEKIVAESIAKSHSSTIADYYEKKLRHYFSTRHHFWYHIIGYSKPLFRLLQEVEGLDRYFNVEEHAIMARIAEKIRAKDNLDSQQAIQGLLKGWLFVHIPFTYSMILLATIHGIMAWKLS